MDSKKKRSSFTFKKLQSDESKTAQPQPVKEKERKARGDCSTATSSSHTHYYAQQTYNKLVYDKITSDEFCGISESMSGSSDTFRCVHGPEGKQYTQRGLLKRNLLKELDPIPQDKKWTEKCDPPCGWEIAKTLEFLVKNPTAAVIQTERFLMQLDDFAKISDKGFKIDVLQSLCVILDYLIESLPKMPIYRESLTLLLKSIAKPILLNVASDVVTYFDTLRDYLGYLGYLLMRVESDDLFDLVSKGLQYQLAASDKMRGQNAAMTRHTLAAAKKVLVETVVRMIAISTPHRFGAYIQIAFILACDSVESCVDFCMENIFENIFYRFNPYFPERELPVYEINPSKVDDDCNVKLGDSSVNMQKVLSLLLVLAKTMKQYVEENPTFKKQIPCPDTYAQRCFVWAFRYECRAREHRHQRSTLIVIAQAMLHFFGNRLEVFSCVLMPDVMTLSVMTELPLRNDWTCTVNFNTSQEDVLFKKLLISFSCALLRVFPYNKFMAEDRLWVVGLMYLVDPGLCKLRAKWTTILFSELRQTALQALIITIKLLPTDTTTQISLIRRIMWYVEWFSESQYELAVLYWCMRLLELALYTRDSPNRKIAVRGLFKTHGIIILIQLCHTLLNLQVPIKENVQNVIVLNLRMLTSAVEYKGRISCCVYPSLRWPGSINRLVNKMMNIHMYMLDKHYIVSDRWSIAMLNFIWEAVIWKTEYRDMFIENNGVYHLLDVITMTEYPVQCICLALICDVVRAGDAVGQLVTWRANFGASSNTVPRGATIATLLAAICKRNCIAENIQLDENNIIQDIMQACAAKGPAVDCLNGDIQHFCVTWGTTNLDFPILTKNVRDYMFDPDFAEGKNYRTMICLTASNIAGSLVAKCFAILQMLSEDLSQKVALADEAYHLYKDVDIKPEHEAMLVLCSHYLTMKLNEAWSEIELQSPGYEPDDDDILNEFLQSGRGWCKNIQEQQMAVIAKHSKKECEKETTLYSFLERVRLNVALDALREVKCNARATDRNRVVYTLLSEAVHAYHRRAVVAKKITAAVASTYEPPLDENLVGQSIKVINILPKHKPRKREVFSEPSSPLYEEAGEGTKSPHDYESQNSQPSIGSGSFRGSQ